MTDHKWAAFEVNVLTCLKLTKLSFNAIAVSLGNS